MSDTAPPSPESRERQLELEIARLRHDVAMLVGYLLGRFGDDDDDVKEILSKLSINVDPLIAGIRYAASRPPGDA